jgi:hypothetical protein
MSSPTSIRLNRWLDGVAVITCGRRRGLSLQLVLYLNVTLPIWTSNAPGQFGQKTLDRRYNRYRLRLFRVPPPASRLFAAAVLDRLRGGLLRALNRRPPSRRAARVDRERPPTGLGPSQQ